MSLSLTSTEFWILTVIADGPKHGYAIMRDVEAASAARVQLKATTLYTTLDRLAHTGLVAVAREEIVDGRARRYFELTDPGSERLTEEAGHLAAQAALARQRLARRVAPATASGFAGTAAAHT